MRCASLRAAPFAAPPIQGQAKECGIVDALPGRRGGCPAAKPGRNCPEKVSADELAAIQYAGSSHSVSGSCNNMRQVEENAMQVAVFLEDRCHLRAVAAADVRQHADT